MLVERPKTGGSTDSPLEPCRLCLELRLLRKSHILPELVYRPTYDEKHRTLRIGHDHAHIARIQKGLREPLFCDDCEGRLQRFEGHFKRAWYRDGRIPRQAPAEGGLVIEGLDYAHFKLFHLSILWRASVAKRPEFAQVALGPHEEEIRKMLLAADPGPTSRYPISGGILYWPDTREVLIGLIMSPVKTRAEGCTTYHFVFGGCVWSYRIGVYVSPIPNWFSEGGTLVLPAIDVREFRPIANFMRVRASLKSPNAGRSRARRPQGSEPG